MSRAVIDYAEPESNYYTLIIPGYGYYIPAQCITKDVLAAGSEVEIVDIDNYSPDLALSYNRIRILPNTGNYTYFSNKGWVKGELLHGAGFPATLAKAFMFASRQNPRWQTECPLYRIGTVVSKIDNKYLNVRIWSRPLATGGGGLVLRCRTDYMSCDTDPFGPGDEVVVKFEDACREKSVVVGFWDFPQSCEKFVVCNVDANYYFVWSLETNSYADIEDPDGGSISFPCVASKLESWLETHLVNESEEVYEWVGAGEYMTVNEFNTPILSLNDGCETLWCTYEDERYNEFFRYCDEYEFLNEQGWEGHRVEFMPAYHWPGGPNRPAPNRLLSYNLSGGLLGEDTSCFRSHREEGEWYKKHITPCDESLPEFFMRDYRTDVIWFTPIGESDRIPWLQKQVYYQEFNDNPYPGIAGQHQDINDIPNSQDPDPIFGVYWHTKAMYIETYYGTIMIQLYFYQINKRNTHGIYTWFPTSPYWRWVFTDFVYSRVNLVMAAVDRYDLPPDNIDPLNQTRNGNFENAVESLINYTITQDSVPDHRVFTGVFTTEVRG